jgi:guanine deaminase
MQAYRSSILHFKQDPFQQAVVQHILDEKAHDGAASQSKSTIQNEVFEYFFDGLLIVQNGKVVKVGEAKTLLVEFPDVPVTVYTDSLLTPGFVDTHTHMPQTEMLAGFGEQLLSWLETYTFPTEAKFADRDHCENIVKIYLSQLLRNGTTTANVFCTMHKHSAEIFFQNCLKLNLRMVAGKVMMDSQFAPEFLRDEAQQSYIDTKDLIETYHGTGRCEYAITPRFAPTSTPKQLSLAGELFKEYASRGVHMHTHLSENLGEIAWVREIFNDSYLNVYDKHGLVGPRAVFAHCVHVTDQEQDRLAESGSAIAFCPTSNNYLGSGHFNLDQVQSRGVRVGVGTDTAGGTSFNVGLTTMGEAYKTQQVGHQKSLNAFRSFYLTTLGGAKALYLDDKIGNFEQGKEADFVVLDLKGTQYFDFRVQHSNGTLHDLLFSLTTIGDDRMIKATYAMGNKVYDKEQSGLIVDLLQ